MAITCRVCGARTSVSSTVTSADGSTITRRRRCSGPEPHTSTTTELERLELAHLGVRQTGSGAVSTNFNREKLIEDLARSLFFSREKVQQRSRLSAIADAVIEGLLRPEVRTFPPDPGTRRTHPHIRRIVKDDEITGLVERELRSDPTRVQWVLYALAVRGRNDFSGRAGWEGAREALDWIRRNFPGIEVDTAGAPTAVGWDLRDVPEDAREPRLVVKRNSKPRTFSFDQFQRSVAYSMFGRKDSQQKSTAIAKCILADLEGQPNVHAEQLAVMALNYLRRVDDVGYLRCAITVKRIDSVTDVANEAAALIVTPSRRLAFRMADGRTLGA